MSDTLDKNNTLDQAETLPTKMVTVEIEGKPFQVPAGITLIKALWYAGQDVIRGVGCLGGFCGACATYYRTKDDPKVKTCLACSKAVEDGMSFSFMPAFPARKATYNLLELKDPKQD
ncbi:MAG: (2Fe-2S)-binding protein, partial [Nitrospirota bacterium]|nr:(2Fe-2S)-binding protein [Nitrospirota bacterium]